MAVNTSGNMNYELWQGVRDGSYQELAPNWSTSIQNPPTERLDWPTYRRVQMHSMDTLPPEALGNFPEREVRSPESMQLLRGYGVI